MAVLDKLSRRTLYLLLLYHLKTKRNAKYKKRMWVRKLFRERKTKGAFNLLIKDMELHDHEYFFKFFRMTPTKYEHLLGLVAPSNNKMLYLTWSNWTQWKIDCHSKVYFCRYFSSRSSWYVSNKHDLDKQDNKWNMCCPMEYFIS